MDQRHVAFVGAGAVGCYFGGMLARSGVAVTLIGREPHVGAINRDGLFLERQDFQEYVRVKAETRPDPIRDAGIVLLCVKTADTESAAASLAPYLAEGALLYSFQNGVDNVSRIHKATGLIARPAAVWVAAAMTAPGHVRHNGRGDIVVGENSPLVEMLESAGVPCRVSENIDGEIWTKFIMNCAYNALSAVTRAQYKSLRDNPHTAEVMAASVAEVAAVARASGVILSSDDELMDAVLRLGEAMATATSSTEQDLSRGRPTEIDSLNGYVARYGLELGVPTPVNQTLHAVVKMLEQSATVAA